MRKYKTLFSYSFRDYGDKISVSLDDRDTPLFIGSHNDYDMAEACRVLAAEMLECAHQFEYAKDFVAPKFDKENREKQLEKVRQLMSPIFEKED